MSQTNTALQLKEPDFITSKDGTRLAYYTIGTGPAVIVVPGAMARAKDYTTFAQALASDFTVHILERRGRGLSGPQGENYSITRECEDVATLQAKTKASYMVGHSFGGLVSLETARRNPAITKLAVYEPGVSIDGSIPIDWADAYQQKLRDGQLDDAFIVFTKAMNPQSRKTPNWLLKLILPRVLGKEGMEEARKQLPANLREHQEVARLDNSYGNYKEVTAQTLLLFGGKSPDSTRHTIDRLTQTLPSATTKEFPKLDHFGIDQKGSVEVAGTIRDFLLK